MYSLPQVYGDQPFDSQKYLPRCMYPSKPYYEGEDSSNPKSGDSLPSMSSILPLPLLPTDIDLNDANIKNTLDDVLSRQMLILCRLNQLEQQLLAQFKLTSTEASNVELPKLEIQQKLEDIAVHFNLDQIPLSLFAIVNALRKQSVPVMVNLHVHSSVATQPGILARVAELKHRLQTAIGFNFTTTEQYLSRSQFQVIITFIATATTTEPYVAFGAGQNVISGELAIARQLIHLVAPTEEKLSGSSNLWSVLANPKLVASDKAVLEQLGQFAFNLSESQFLFEQAKPTLVDVVLWSLTTSEFSRSSIKVASALRGPQLLNPKWQASVRQFVTSR